MACADWARQSKAGTARVKAHLERDDAENTGQHEADEQRSNRDLRRLTQLSRGCTPRLQSSGCIFAAQADQSSSHTAQHFTSSTLGAKGAAGWAGRPAEVHQGVAMQRSGAYF